MANAKLNDVGEGGIIVPKKGEPPANAFVMSALAIFAVTVVWGLVIGGTISAAIALAGEDNYATTPTDANGFRVTAHKANNNSITSWPTSSQTTVVSTNSMSGNWTKLNGPSSTISSTVHSDDYFTIQVPSLAFPDPANHTLWRVNIEFTTSSSYNSAGSGQHQFDVELTVNGTRILKYNSVKSDAYKEDGNSNKRYYYEADLTFNGVHELNYRNEVGECYPNCVFELNFTDYKSDVSSSSAPWNKASSNQQVLTNVQTFTTDVDTGNFALAVMPWVISVVNLGIIVASTPLWNPVSGWMRGRGGGF